VLRCAALWEVKQIMNAFCQRKSYSPNQVRFLFEGSRVNGEQTPNDLEMEEGDIIVRRLLRFLGALLRLTQLSHHPCRTRTWSKWAAHEFQLSRFRIAGAHAAAKRVETIHTRTARSEVKQKCTSAG
jgi:hypothetical protein